MNKILKFVIAGATIFFASYTLYSHSQYTPFFIGIAFLILFFEWVYLRLFEKRKGKWDKFIEEVEANCNNLDWLYKKKDEITFLSAADWINRKSHKDKLSLIENHINNIKQHNEQENKLLKNENHKLRDEIIELKNSNQVQFQDNVEIPFQLAIGKNFSKIDYIRVINTLCRLGFYKDCKKDVMHKMGLLINVDLSEFNNNLSQGFSKTQFEKQISIFLSMRASYEEEYNERLNKNNK